MNRGLVGLFSFGWKTTPFKDIKRYAGHSKFANRKHIKQANDHARSLLFQQYRRKMAVAILEGGSANPVENSKLAAIIEFAKKNNMPQAAINNFLQKKGSSNFQKGYVELYGPGHCGLIIQCQVVNINNFKLDINHISKKFKCKADPSVRNIFVHKGVIWAEKDCSLDKAMEDAINIDIEDIEQVENDGRETFVFNCKPEFLDSVERKLQDLDYVILLAEEEFIPNRVVSLTGEQLDLVQRFSERILREFGDQVIKIHDNIENRDDTLSSQ